MKNLLIIETEYLGHYLTGYIKYILRGLHKKKVKIHLLVTDKTLKNGGGALRILKNEKTKFYIDTIKYVDVSNKNFFSLSFYQFKLYFSIKKKFYELTKNNNFDHIFLTSAQRIDKAISIFGSPFKNNMFSCVFLGLKFHLKMFAIKSSSTNHFLSKLLFYKFLQTKNLFKIITNDYLLEKFVIKKDWQNKSKILSLHDPKEFNYQYDKNYSRKVINVDNDRFVILVYGAIINSKGINELIQLFKVRKSNVHCIIVGKQIGETKNFLKNDKYVQSLKRQKKISLYDGWHSEKKEAIFFSASDAIWIGYKNYSFPSGVLYQAISIKKPCIVSNDGFTHELNKRYKFGVSIDINNPKAIMNSIDLIKKNKKVLLINIKEFQKICKPNIWVDRFRETFKNFF